MARSKAIFSWALAALVLSATALAGQSPSHSTLPPKAPRILSAEEIFKRVSPSVMVVESLDAKGSVAAFGSGVVIAPGHVITNRHVIEDGVTYRIDDNGKTWPAKLLRVDPDHDLAELSVAGLDAPSVRVVDSSKLAVGETVYAIGAPEGLELTISQGLISGLRDFDKSLVIQTSAAISPGSSGGGLFDAQGWLVGITTFYLKEGQSLNFALPAEWTIALDRQPVNAAPETSENSPEFQALVWFEVGIKALERGEYEVAVRAYLEETRLTPEDAAAWTGLGGSYLLLGQYDDAVNAGREAIRVMPDDDAAWSLLGLAYLKLGQYSKAVRALQEDVRLKPDDPATWYALGFAYKGGGQRSEVIKAYEKLKTLDPKLADKFFREAVLP